MKMEKVYTNLTNGGPVSVYVKDGVITRIRPLQIPETDFPKPWVIVGNDGKKYSPPKAFRLAPPVHGERNKIYSKNRILYPMKRVDFDPNGERNPQNRGKSEYVRISWDEALDIVAGEIKRIRSTYGGHAVTGMTSSHHNWGVVGYKMGPFGRFMNMIHYTPVFDNPDSWEGWHWGATHTYGFQWRLGMPEQFDLLEDALQNVEMIVFWSNDPDSTRGTYSGQESHIWRVWLKEKGVKCVFIDPYYNYTAAVMDGTWLAPRPGSDTAIAMAIAYVWITEGTYDTEYVRDRTYGFDEFKDMILGKGDDGYAKTPEWAEEQSGIPARKIISLAREWAKKTTCLSSGCRGGQGSACRTEYGTEWARMMVLLQAMQGLGKPGISIWGTTMGAPSSYKWFPGYAEPQGTIAKADIAKHKPALTNPTKQRLFRLNLPDAILDGQFSFRGEGFCGNSLEQQFVMQHYPIEGPVKMFYRYGGSFIGTMSDTNKWVKMYQSPELEFVVNQDCWFGGEARFADIILPACTNFEREDIGEWATCGGYTTNAHIGNNWRVVVRQKKCIEPLGESKSDYEIFRLLAQRLGFEEEFTEGNTELDWARKFFETSDICKDGDVTWEEFNEKGYYLIPCPEDRKPTPSLRWFAEGRECDTPDTGNRKRLAGKPKELGTYTGKIEFASVSLRENLPDDKERPVVPHFIPWEEGYKSKQWEKYPLQIISPHPRFSFHTHYDNHVEWLNEIPMHRVLKDGYAWWPVRINPVDAAKRGISEGDIVELYNDRGSVLAYAHVTYRVPQGVIHSYGCSAKYDPVEPGKPGSTDKAGCVNLLTQSKLLSKNAPGMTPNSCLCEVRKWEG
jgi:molybdopterin guanine dinucleotide-containing S/N-oxide reductase-like protein